MPKTNGKPTNGHRNGKNGNGSGNGHKAISPQQAKIARLELRNQAIEMFLEGVSVADIARTLGVGGRTVARFVEEVRQGLIDKYQDYFDRRVGVWLDQNLDALQEMSTLLADREFLEKAADTARINAIADAFRTVSDKTFVLLIAAGRHSDAEKIALPAGPGPAVDGASDSA